MAQEKQAPVRAAAPKAPAGKPQKNPAEKKKKKVSVAGILCVLIIVLVGAFCALTYFNVFGLKDVVIDLLGLDDQLEAQVAANLAEEDQRKAALDEQEKTLKRTQSDLDKREREVAKLEEAADERSAQLDERQAQMDAKEQAELDAKEEVDALGPLLSSMDAKKAADALAAIDSASEIARILAKVDSQKAGDIVNNMESPLAARVLAELARLSQ